MNAYKSWKAKGYCPQCGGPVDLEAGDPLLSCSFCKTNLYMVPKGPLRYTLPIKNDLTTRREGRLVYLPYWRFRGLKYKVLDQRQVNGSLLDTTVTAFSGIDTASSLGIRPQVATLNLAVNGKHLIPPQRNAKEALYIAEKRLLQFEEDKAFFERFVGETQCLIYAPFILKEFPKREKYILKGVWGICPEQKIDKSEITAMLKALDGPSRQDPLHFLPLICPECGYNLPAISGAVALLCQNCSRAWLVRRGRFSPLTYGALKISASSKDLSFLPFWHLTMGFSGLPIKSRADLRLSVISYQNPPESWSREAVQILIPAFKLSPRLFLRVAGNMSLAPIDLSLGDQCLKPGQKTEPVRLSLEEAAQAVKVILSDLLKRHRKLYSLIPKTCLSLRHTKLLYLPFKLQGREFVDAYSSQAIPANAIELGKSI
ncbi:MAG: hypothetical protein U9Q89_09910 [Thermodesulfobacteriota bacterium]|nr:hypothetical protein [Thermodesulfobacteriota bacterium]